MGNAEGRKETSGPAESKNQGVETGSTPKDKLIGVLYTAVAAKKLAAKGIVVHELSDPALKKEAGRVAKVHSSKGPNAEVRECIEAEMVEVLCELLEPSLMRVLKRVLGLHEIPLP
jgi:hypothetical protein